MLPFFRHAVAAWALLSCGSVLAVEPEIHVYDDEIAGPGTVGLTVHSNYIVRDHSLTGGAEWTYGALPWLECGVYFPIYTYVGTSHRLTLDGTELRALLVPPSAVGEHFFYGVNLALGLNNRVLSEHSVAAEVTPILGARWGAFTLSVNPTVERGFDGYSSVEFLPSERLEYAVSHPWTVALEHYSEVDRQKLFAVVQRRFDSVAIEAGAGWGLTHASDPVTLKLIFSFDLQPFPRD